MSRTLEHCEGKRALLKIRDHLVATEAAMRLIEHVEALSAAREQRGARLVFDSFDEDLAGGVSLAEVTDLRVGHSDRANLLLQGENLLVLEQLAETYEGKIDVVYVDPPYNTGMQALGYVDEFGDGQACRHSHWLSAMRNRLAAVRPLLSSAGVLFLHLDDNEFAHGYLLCSQLFGESNLRTLIWPKTDPAFDDNRVERPFHNIKAVHEYIIVAFVDQNRTTFRPNWSPKGMGAMESILLGLGTTSSAKDEMAEVFGDRLRFRTPKPMRLVKELVRAAGSPDAIVLDFYAGSGTTGHAVMDLNREDGGQRRFVLVTNNENGICREITYERLCHAIRTQGYDEALRYFVLEGRAPA